MLVDRSTHVEVSAVAWGGPSHRTTDSSPRCRAPASGGRPRLWSQCRGSVPPFLASDPSPLARGGPSDRTAASRPFPTVPGSRFGLSTPVLVAVPGQRASVLGKASVLLQWLRDAERCGALPPHCVVRGPASHTPQVFMFRTQTLPPTRSSRRVRDDDCG